MCFESKGSAPAKRTAGGFALQGRRSIDHGPAGLQGRNRSLRSLRRSLGRRAHRRVRRVRPGWHEAVFIARASRSIRHGTLPSTTPRQPGGERAAGCPSRKDRNPEPRGLAARRQRRSTHRSRSRVGGLPPRAGPSSRSRSLPPGLVRSAPRRSARWLLPRRSSRPRTGHRRRSDRQGCWPPGDVELH